VRFPDHYRFTRVDAEQLAGSLNALERPVCTLKDFVKLDALWPRQAPPLWYVSQSSTVESGRDALDAMLSALLRARATPT
jgi:tetraacyldisaccharide-1-P 4'-kinase